MPTGGIPIETRFKGKFSVESIKTETIKLVEKLEEGGIYFNFADKTISIRDEFDKKANFHTFINLSSDVWSFEAENAKVSYDNIKNNFNYQGKDRENQNPYCFLTNNDIPTIISHMKRYSLFINYYNNLNSYVPEATNNYLEKIKYWESFFSEDSNSFFRPREQALIFKFYKELHEKKPEDIIKMALKNFKTNGFGSISCSISDNFIITKHQNNNQYYLENNDSSDKGLYNSFVFSSLSYDKKSNLKFKISDSLCNEPAVHLSPLNKICLNINSTIPVLEQFFSLMVKLEIKTENLIEINKETLDLYILKTDDYSYKNLYKYLPDSSKDLPLTKIKNGAKNV